LFDDVDFLLTRVHHVARRSGGRDGSRPVAIADARLFELAQKVRIKTRIGGARVGLRRHGRTDDGGEAGKHYTQSHRSIIVQIGAVVLSTRIRRTASLGVEVREG